MLIMIDNYDSFTYNLVQLFYTLGEEVMVFRNDRVSVEELKEMKPAGVVISPGGGVPAQAGISADTVRYFAGKVPVLGICLGHQVIAEVFGAKVGRVKIPRHGKTSEIRHDGKGVFQNLSEKFHVMRYHSLAVIPDTLPKSLEETSFALDDDVCMGIRHKEYEVEGIQFHPESVMTYLGKRILANFVMKCGGQREFLLEGIRGY
ncbi:MAG: aminodeoxychorismate/anthranilate synthase component II [Planctomycetia bacterium]|nr:aminodeoxychorismate/anthranilate synthase component II [Planctomycetia bacterium]